MNKRGGDLHIVIKRFRQSFSENAENSDEPGIIKLTQENANNIITKLGSIEGLLKKIAESSTIEIRELEDEIQREALLHEFRGETNVNSKYVETPGTSQEGLITLPTAHTSIQNKYRGQPLQEDGFPLPSLDAAIALDDLMSVDEKAQAKVQRFFEVNKKFARDRFTKAFALFIKDEALIQMTWTGHREKYAMRCLKNIVEVMWRVWFEKCDWDDFEREMKFEITKSHGRFLKRKTRKTIPSPNSSVQNE